MVYFSTRSKCGDDEAQDFAICQSPSSPVLPSSSPITSLRTMQKHEKLFHCVAIDFSIQSIPPGIPLHRRSPPSRGKSSFRRRKWVRARVRGMFETPTSLLNQRCRQSVRYVTRCVCRTRKSCNHIHIYQRTT